MLICSKAKSKNSMCSSLCAILVLVSYVNCVFVAFRIIIIEIKDQLLIIVGGRWKMIRKEYIEEEGCGTPRRSV